MYQILHKNPELFGIAVKTQRIFENLKGNSRTF